MAIHVLVMGLKDGFFRTELPKYNDLIMEDLHSKAQQFINLEETHTTRSPDEYHTHNLSRETKRPKFHDHLRDDLPKIPCKPKYTTYTHLNASRSIILQEVMAAHLGMVTGTGGHR
ncbi:hypothetical protein TanjilG_21761 [Lupinus angustifolius]|uniref:Uncharacterized protein n=1 Tax=Lupinus angustifolius TaxID=3871 RepID=A0A1J7GV88_LUPAN|nr:hypothetical protein TanjilG_21761 [Lupinus angustifolius]